MYIDNHIHYCGCVRISRSCFCNVIYFKMWLIENTERSRVRFQFVLYEWWHDVHRILSLNCIPSHHSKQWICKLYEMTLWLQCDYRVLLLLCMPHILRVPYYVNIASKSNWHGNALFFISFFVRRYLSLTQTYKIIWDDTKTARDIRYGVESNCHVNWNGSFDVCGVVGCVSALSYITKPNLIIIGGSEKGIACRMTHILTSFHTYSDIALFFRMSFQDLSTTSVFRNILNLVLCDAYIDRIEYVRFVIRGITDHFLNPCCYFIGLTACYAYVLWRHICFVAGESLLSLGDYLCILIAFYLTHARPTCSFVALLVHSFIYLTPDAYASLQSYLRLDIGCPIDSI